MASSDPPPDSTALDELPQETLIRIGSFLITAELGPFRRTCKQIEAKLFNTFANEFFTKRQFMLEHESLEALLGITQHPGLASRLTEVIIGTQALSAGVELIKDRILHGRLSRNTLLQTGTARDMLVQAFANLPNLRTVGLRDYDGAGRLRDGPSARWRSWGWSLGYQGASQDPSELLPILLSALGTARPTKLEIFLRRQLLRFNAFQLRASDYVVLGRLQTLMLAVAGESKADSITPWSTYDDHNHLEAPLRHFLHSAPNLDTLRLNFETDSFIGHRIIDWLSRPTASSVVPDIFHTPSAKLSALRSFEVGMANVAGDVLTRVLTKFDSLKSFSLCKMTLQCPGPDSLSTDCWAEFLEKLSASLPSSSKIRSISIGTALQYRYTPSQPRNYDATLTTWVPEGTAPANTAKASEKARCIVFQAQFTNKTVHQWLKDMSELTFVPGIHSTLRSSSPISIDDSDGDIANDESGSGSDEDA
ncbi:hypothetical protein DOTSEDRAFT_67441, partial [Dothistroma septosporum NZE10]